MRDLIRTIHAPRDRQDETIAAGERPPRREWLVTNGLGGYASGTVAGVLTRRYHGMLVASLPAPLGRMVLLNHLLERVRLPGPGVVWLGDQDEVAGPNAVDRTEHLAEFRLELGMPVWVYQVDGFTIEKRIVMPHEQNTVHITYRVVAGTGTVRFNLRPSVHFRSYDGSVDESPVKTYTIAATGQQYELSAGPDLPTLRMMLIGTRAALTLDEKGATGVPYQMEETRGYKWQGLTVESRLFPRRRRSGRAGVAHRVGRTVGHSSRPHTGRGLGRRTGTPAAPGGDRQRARRRHVRRRAGARGGSVHRPAGGTRRGTARARARRATTCGR